MIVKDLFYGFPEALVLFVVIPLICLLFFSFFRYRQRVLKAFADQRVLVQVSEREHAAVFWIKVVLYCCAFGFAAIALMQPQGNAHYPSGANTASAVQADIKTKRRAHELVFLLDVSASMGVEDTRVGESRLELAKEIIEEVVSRLQGETVSLYAFTTDSSKLVPSTLDHIFLRLLLRNIEVNETAIPGTDLLRSLQSVMNNLNNDPPETLKTVIILSDGGDTALENIDNLSTHPRMERLQQMLKDTEEHNIRVISVGLGSESGAVVPNLVYEKRKIISSLHEEPLELIAKSGRGAYFNGDRNSVIAVADRIFDVIAKDDVFETETSSQVRIKGNTFIVYDHYFQYPLAIAIFCLSAALLIPDRFNRRGTS